ncbi:hypothetical protein [Teichococcus oryzae]|uniref:Uncharacterized protein n=1 Tax=Teichococcus oryzae TaxID=1608942 RepID=A0A5B2TEU6_9PROT|nr:hypothetical protein [Pseudoroseomonas oryzae]KAA2212623.1 hypothetical protein F0Q34_12940 [Pseudoroseomonas oryzae]
MMRLPLLFAAPTALLLAGCGGQAPAPDFSGARGTTVQAIRGEAASVAPLQPEAGDIWSEGLTPSARP